jgi:23S rRNA (adenine-N6)-dimethyltransferase
VPGGPSRPQGRFLGQHFLRPAVAADIVARTGVLADDLVIELGAGTGILTEQLAVRAGRVIAIELDPRLAQRATRRLAGFPNVTVVEADALTCRLPRRSFRVVANIPFGQTAALLRRLLDDRHLPLTAADLVVEWGAAKGYACKAPMRRDVAAWSRHYTFDLGRRIGAASFHPPPAVDAALLAVRRRV